MEIKYLGNSNFRLRGKEGVVMLEYPKVSIGKESLFVIERPGEYEINGIGVIGVKTGESIVFVISIDGIWVAYLENLDHQLSDKELDAIGNVDVLLVPVGEDATGMTKVIENISPSIVVPMWNERIEEADEFLKKAGLGQGRREDKLILTKGTLPEEMEIVTLS